MTSLWGKRPEHSTGNSSPSQNKPQNGTTGLTLFSNKNPNTPTQNTKPGLFSSNFKNLPQQSPIRQNYIIFCKTRRSCFWAITPANRTNSQHVNEQTMSQPSQMEVSKTQDLFAKKQTHNLFANFSLSQNNPPNSSFFAKRDQNQNQNQPKTSIFSNQNQNQKST
ncbi:hypothetical protein M0811_12352 [Anaeramoeba ignava]|uniref:Uncharacterized protein n=1 Tax=Anaeramoeba ignava TaxID=1746090 RepID=A0A9Q0R746_ANAIG|nr:hypothetical protein M0811_12352 [Anaeramoeba ignava]